jgi:hypothetical protein
MYTNKDQGIDKRISLAKLAIINSAIYQEITFP